MKSAKILIVSCILLLSIIGCSIDNREEGGKVDSVYWHEGNNYSVGFIRNGEVVIKRLPYNVPVRVYLDVEEGDKAWYECKWLWSKFNGVRGGECGLHITTIDSLATAGWNHGKLGSGKTTRID